MWIYIFFDLPTNTKKEVRAATKFRKQLLDDGFIMFQYSIYIRHCSSRENLKVHERRIKNILPGAGKISFLSVTDKQFGSMLIFHGQIKEIAPPPIMQLEIF